MNWNKEIVMYARTAHNRTVYASPPSAARATKNRSRASPFVRFFSATIFCARKNAAHFSLSGAKNRRKQPERYARLGRKRLIEYLKYGINIL
jgi:hypothetical protein